MTLQNSVSHLFAGGRMCLQMRVVRLAEQGEGDVRTRIAPDGQRIQTLVLSGYRVVIHLERATRTIHVWAVRRARPRKA